MKKLLLTLCLTPISFVALGNPTSTNELPSQCKKLFTETEQLIEEAEKQPGIHLQFSSIKNKLSQSKKQILALDHEMQIKSCDKGLVALNNLKELQR